MTIFGDTAHSLNRPAFIGIHEKTEETKVLYVSSGIRSAIGFPPSQVVNAEAKSFISDSFDNGDYMSIYESRGDEDDDDSSAFTWSVNLRTAHGPPVLHRLIGFSCENSILFIGIAYPEIPCVDRRELEVQALDGAMKSLNVTRQKKLAAAQQQQPGASVPLYYAQSKQVKAVLVMERPDACDIETEDTGRRPSGPLIVFVTGSISRIVDADTSDVMRLPFLKLVAPECVLQVSRYFERLTESMEIMFETFSLLQRPHVIDGDIVVADEVNQRVLVECLGAAVQDGVAILIRKLKVVPPPKRDKLGNYIHARIDSDTEKENPSLFELLSTDPETSDAADGWTQFR
ncbi:hypothetical protein IWW51_004515 [Coemansia sp. RSA 2702]|nr:hypothetical protein IWW51_004515 [Coemansia sp. RSA 2702]